jgi:hypothetical protein
MNVVLVDMSESNRFHFQFFHRQIDLFHSLLRCWSRERKEKREKRKEKRE